MAETNLLLTDKLLDTPRCLVAADYGAEKGRALHYFAQVFILISEAKDREYHRCNISKTPPTKSGHDHPST